MYELYLREGLLRDSVATVTLRERFVPETTARRLAPGKGTRTRRLAPGKGARTRRLAPGKGARTRRLAPGKGARTRRQGLELDTWNTGL
ncbi:MAG: hypothetical protein QM784_19805 [Polyangiaceae bacterium]